MGLIKLQKRTFATRISDQLREAILTGELPPGAPVVENVLAAHFGVSRGPLREAIRQLIEEDLLVQVPFTGTHVTVLSVETVREIYSLRTALEIFAFELIWNRRDDAFKADLISRQTALLDAIDNGDEIECIRRELHLHSLVYETTNHKILIGTWKGLRGKLQLYWASNHLAHGRRGPKRNGHDKYVETALGEDLEDMRNEIRDHMWRGGDITERFIATRDIKPTPSGLSA